MSGSPPAAGRDHLDATLRAVESLGAQLELVDRWGAMLARRLAAGNRLLVAGNGGSAAQAQHLTAELVGRYMDDRRPLSAIALHSETSSLTAITNDYGPDVAFARQVHAHGRPGDVMLLLSTSGRSANVLAAADAARACGMESLALTGPGPNPLSRRCDEALCVEAPATPQVQEAHLVAIHLLCAAIDAHLPGAVDIDPGEEAAVTPRTEAGQ